MTLRVTLSAILILSLVDLVLSIVWFEAGAATEANPLMSEAYSHGPVVFAGAKLTLVSSGIWLLWRRRDRRLARGGAALCFVVYTGMALYQVIGGLLSV